MTKHCCKTCLWSRWELTPTGRIKKDENGRCLFPIPIQPVQPECVKPFIIERYAIAPDDGTHCVCFSENTGDLLPRYVNPEATS